LGAFEYGMPSSSSVAVSSSATVSIVTHLNHVANAPNTATVFDLQGRYLGILQSEQLRGHSVAEALRAKFKTPGAYLVRYGRSMSRVNVK
jgi:hypothetical protein